MIRRCWMVVKDGKESVFIDKARAYEYCRQMHGYVVNMFGQDGDDPTPEDDRPLPPTPSDWPFPDDLPGVMQ